MIGSRQSAAGSRDGRMLPGVGSRESGRTNRITAIATTADRRLHSRLPTADCRLPTAIPTAYCLDPRPPGRPVPRLPVPEPGIDSNTPLTFGGTYDTPGEHAAPPQAIIAHGGGQPRAVRPGGNSGREAGGGPLPGGHWPAGQVHIPSGTALFRALQVVPHILQGPGRPDHERRPSRAPARQVRARCRRSRRPRPQNARGSP